jgi:hypothetical protein
VIPQIIVHGQVGRSDAPASGTAPLFQLREMGLKLLFLRGQGLLILAPGGFDLPEAGLPFRQFSLLVLDGDHEL